MRTWITLKYQLKIKIISCFFSFVYMSLKINSGNVCFIFKYRLWMVVIYSSLFIFYLLGILLIGILCFCNVQWMWKSLMSKSLWPRGLYSPWNSPGQNTWVSSCSLLQGIFPTEVSHITGRFFTSWAIREAPRKHKYCMFKRACLINMKHFRS